MRRGKDEVVAFPAVAGKLGKKGLVLKVGAKLIDEGGMGLMINFKGGGSSSKIVGMNWDCPKSCGCGRIGIDLLLGSASFDDGTASEGVGRQTCVVWPSDIVAGWLDSGDRDDTSTVDGAARASCKTVRLEAM